MTGMLVGAAVSGVVVGETDVGEAGAVVPLGDDMGVEGNEVSCPAQAINGNTSKRTNRFINCRLHHWSLHPRSRHYHPRSAQDFPCAPSQRPAGRVL